MRRAQDFNTGIYDGEVGHAETNSALAGADLAVLVGEQRRQAHFAVDRRLPKLHAGDPRVLAFWQAFALVPATYREAFWQMGACAVLCRGAAAVFYHDRRRHQALHVGRRRRTLYLAEGLFNGLVEAPERTDSSSWALAAGLVQAICQLSDYVLLSALVGFGRKTPTEHVLSAGDLPVLRRLVTEAPVPRKADEIEAFAAAYQQALTQLAPQPDSRADEEKALDLWDGAFEAAWARARTQTKKIPHISSRL